MFEDKYKELIGRIVGDDENVLDFDTFNNTWRVRAVNESSCVCIGEVDGVIEVEAKTLDELLIKFEEAIDKYNSSKVSR